MGRAIVRDPQVFLFDEPLSNLDAKHRVQMRAEIRTLQRRLGTTSIYVTHDQQEAMPMAETLLVLNKGRVEQMGAPLDVCRRPASTFVASFIGSPPMNLVPARIEGGAVRLGGTTLATGVQRPAGEVTLGFRPEDLVPGGGGLGVAVTYVEELGASRLIHGSRDGVSILAVAPPDMPLGETASFGIRPDLLHFFDPASGVRIG
jgi:sn-glycerol 3-phosphate transport system ATP-binding protein